jgi:predicted acylesterase/phospholipase RssA
MLRALLERDVVPDVVVGSSVGALNGALAAADPTAANVERLTTAWNGISGRVVLDDSSAPGPLLDHGPVLALARHGGRETRSPWCTSC